MRQLCSVCCSGCRLGYKAKQGFVVFRVRVRRGNRKRPVHRGRINGKPKTQGVNQLKFRRNLRSVAEERVGKRCGNLRVLNSYWVSTDGMYKYFEVRFDLKTVGQCALRSYFFE
jgi:large subunit ribosomal protein L15e